MIRNGDRVLLAVSGGKDSLSLLQVLLHLRRVAPVRFNLGVITVDPCIPGFDPSPLQAYYQTLKLDYHYEQQPLLEEALQRLQGDSFCAYCARMKRGIMYRVARQQGYSTLALAQHLDDLAESFLMSAFHGGQLKTMRAHYTISSGDLRVIRPLVYVRERQTADFAKAAALPVIPDSCPACFQKPTERSHFKQLLRTEEQRYPHLMRNLLHTLRPLMAPIAPELNHATPAPQSSG